MRPMNDFDIEKAKAALAEYDRPKHEWTAYDGFSAGLAHHLRAALTALSRRPAGEVGELVEELRGDCYCQDCVDQERTAVGDTGSVGICLHCRAADALTRLSAPVDAGVEELAAWHDKCAAQYRANDWAKDARKLADRHEASAQTIRTLSRQLTTERQAWEKVRAEIEALCNPDPDPDGSLPSDEYLRVANKALAILAQHAPKEG